MSEIELYEPALQVYHLKMAGFSFEAIASKLEIKRTEAIQLYNDFKVQRAATLSPDERRASLILQRDRLEDLQSSYYGEAIAGNIKAAEFVLKLIQEQAKLEHLYDADGTDAQQVANILVVGGSQEEFIRALNTGRMVTGSSGEDEKDQEDGA